MQYSWEIHFKGKKLDILKVWSGFKSIVSSQLNLEIEEDGQKVKNNKDWGVYTWVTPNFDKLSDNDIAQLGVSADDAGLRLFYDEAESLIKIAPELDVLYVIESADEPENIYSKSGTTGYEPVFEGYEDWEDILELFGLDD